MNMILLVVSFVISVFFTHRFCDPASWLYVLDNPNERSLHTRPMPSCGGLAILLAVFLTSLVMGAVNTFSADMIWISAGVLLVAIIAFIDDRLTIHPAYRLAVYTAVAVMLVHAGFFFPTLELPGIVLDWPEAVVKLISLLFIIWMINLYNFMDGMDGFAGGMAVFGFGTFALLGGTAGHELFSALNMLVAAAAGGFLVFNFPPARIFMGDVGSSTLGLLAAAFSLWGTKDGIFSFWIALLVFSPFIVDATVTLIRRLLRREKIWQAHRTHYYQQIVQAGWGHRKTVILEYFIMLGCGVTAIWGVRAPEKLQAAMLLGWMIYYFLFFFWASQFTSKRKKTGTL